MHASRSAKDICIYKYNTWQGCCSLNRQEQGVQQREDTRREQKLPEKEERRRKALIQHALEN